MATLKVRNLRGDFVEDIELDDRVFAADINEHLFWEAVKQQMALRRLGTHSSLRRSEVRGGGKKPYRQKGTGRARQGSTRAPNHVGGGKVFSPKPRSYVYRLPKKVVRAALRSAISLRVRESSLLVIDALNLPDFKTQRMVKALESLKIDSALIVDTADNVNLVRAVRNLADVKFLPVEALNLYDILNHKTLLVAKAVVRTVESQLLSRTSAEIRGTESAA